MIVQVRNGSAFNSLKDTHFFTSSAFTRFKRGFLSLWEDYGEYKNDGNNLHRIKFYDNGTWYEEVMEFFGIERQNMKGIKRAYLQFKPKSIENFDDEDLNYAKSEARRVIDNYGVMGNGWYEHPNGRSRSPQITPNELDEDIIASMYNYFELKKDTTIYSKEEFKQKVILAINTKEYVERVEKVLSVNNGPSVEDGYKTIVYKHYLVEEILKTTWGDATGIPLANLINMTPKQFFDFTVDRLSVKTDKKRWAKALQFVLKAVQIILIVIAIVSFIISLGSSSSASSATASAGNAVASAGASTGGAVGVEVAQQTIFDQLYQVAVDHGLDIFIDALDIAYDLFQIGMQFQGLKAPKHSNSSQEKLNEEQFRYQFVFNSIDSQYSEMFDMQQHIEIGEYPYF
jgi:hypothetical protein